MCTREMTLGEEIINLSTKGVDIPTVERMYRKYIEVSAKKDATECCEGEFTVDEWVRAVLFGDNKSEAFLPDDIEVGDQIEIPLEGLGTFTATAHKVTDDKVLFIFDDYVARRPMNNENTNKGGYDESDLKDWIDVELFNKFPLEFRKRISDLSIPTVGEIFGWDDEWSRNTFERDDNRQLPLMKLRRNRVAYYDNEISWGWLRNATKKEVSSADFACVGFYGSTSSGYASNSYGVRPKFWLVR